MFPYVFPLQPRNALNVALHTVGAVLFHPVGDMTVDIQGERCRGMTQIPLHGFHIVPILEGQDSVCFTGLRPLWP